MTFRGTIFSAVALVRLIQLSTAAQAGVITWNTQGQSTNVAAGQLSFDELRTSLSHTYQNVLGEGFDIRVSGSEKMRHSTGDLNYTARGSSIKFEFFQTGTTTPVALLGFKIDWLDLDASETMGPFTIVDASGNATILDTNSPFFIKGANIGVTDLDGSNGVNPDGLRSTADGNWSNTNISFITDFSSIAIRSFSIDQTNGFIAPTSITAGGASFSSSPPVVPEPTGFAILFGLSVAGAVWSRRRA